MAQYAANEIENMPDSPVAREDLGAGGIPRGAGARSPLFWKVLLLSVAVIWGYSFTTMKDALGTIPVSSCSMYAFCLQRWSCLPSSTSASLHISTLAI